MSMSDNIADMLTRIRNAQKSSLLNVITEFSNLKERILSILRAEGYISDYVIDKDANLLKIFLKYSGNSKRPVSAIKQIERVSKPSRRVYVKVSKIGEYYDGMGIQILSTSKGVLSNRDAKNLNVGGEVLCKVF